MDEPLRVTNSVVIPPGELHWRFSRSSGPGGQGVNTTDSRAELRFDVAGSPCLPDHLRARALTRLAHRLVDGVLVIVASEHRSQLQNRRSAQRRLVDVLGEALAPPARRRRKTRPSRSANERRLRTKKGRSNTKRLRGRVGDE